MGTRSALGPQDSVRLGNACVLWGKSPGQAREFQLWRFGENAKLFALADPTPRSDGGCKEMSQIQSLAQPLMLALKRSRGQARLSWAGRRVRNVGVPGLDCRLGVPEFLHLQSWNLNLFTFLIPNKPHSYQ